MFKMMNQHIEFDIFENPELYSNSKNLRSLFDHIDITCKNNRQYRFYNCTYRNFLYLYFYQSSTKVVLIRDENYFVERLYLINDVHCRGFSFNMIIRKSG